MRLTDLAHQLLQPHLHPGDLAVDGTAGQGHDTLFLAQAVGPTGQVLAFDPQPAALAATQARLNQAGITTASFLKSEILNLKSGSRPASVCLVQAGHENAPTLLADLPPPQAVVLNLGYLPGADHALTTTSSTTLAFLTWAAAKLAPGGVISILAYRAHPGGEEEAQAVASFAQKLASENWSHQAHQGPPGRLPSPVLHFLTKPLASN
jgi:predicted methyltransferase